MAADGSLKFDTKIDTSGLEKGTGTLEKAFERLIKAVDRLSDNISNVFNNAGQAAEAAAAQSSKAAEGIDQVTESAKRAEKQTKSLQEQMDAIKVDRGEYQEQESTPARRVNVDDPSAYGYDPAAIDFIEKYTSGEKKADQETNEFIQKISSLKKELKDLESQGMYFGDEKYDETYLKLEKVNQALKDYKQELTNPTPDAVVFPADSLQGKIDRLKKELKDLESQGRSFGDALYDSTYKALNQAQSDLNIYKKDLTTPVKIPVQFDANSFEGQKEALRSKLLGMEQQGISLGNADYDQTYVQLQQVIQAENEYKKSLLNADAGQKKASASANKLRDSVNGAGKAAQTSGKGMKLLGRISRMMMMRFVMQAVMAAMGAIKEGFQNLARYSGSANQTLSSLMSSLLYLKNSLAAGFAPILSVAVPAINALIDAIASALAWIGQLTAALTGKSTFVKAKKTQEDYAKSLKKTGSAAKNAGKSLADFDKLRLLDKQNSGGGGGSGSGTDPSQMFETVAVSSSLVKALDALKSKWNDLSSLFAKGFKVGLGDVTPRFETIKKGLQSIKESLLGIFSDPQVQAAASIWGNKMVYDLGVITGSIASVGITLAANLIGGTAKYLEEAQGRIKQYIIDMFDITGETADIVANFSAAFAEVFSAFADENGQTFTANLIGFFSNSFMGVTELFAKLGRDLLNALLTPFTNNAAGFKKAFDGLLGVASQVMGDIKDIFTDAFDQINQTYDEHIAPMFDAFTEGFTEIYGSALEAFETYILPALQNVADKFSEVKEQYLQPFISSFVALFGQLADTITAVWNSALQPFLNWIVQNFGPLIGNAIQNIGNYFNIFLSVASAAAEGITGALTGLLEFIQGVFTGDIEKALNGIKNIFRSIFNGIVSLVEIAVNSIVSGLNGISFDVPDWVPLAGGQHFGFNVSSVKLPRLATGTVVPRQAGEFAAILGDNHRETEVVSPLSTIKQALAEALREMGNGLGGGDIHLTIELDGDVVYKKVVERNKERTVLSGRNPLLV
nr:MAG TPA: minor tail protein [Caudoviricetes sp.]